MNSTRIQVIMSDDLLVRIDDLAEFIGTSRSSLCASIIALALPEWEKIYNFPVPESNAPEGQ